MSNWHDHHILTSVCMQLVVDRLVSCRSAQMPDRFGQCLQFVSLRLLLQLGYITLSYPVKVNHMLTTSFISSDSLTAPHPLRCMRGTSTLAQVQIVCHRAV